MARDSDSLKIEKWAESGDVATPESQGLARATGWPATYSQPDGSLPKREVMNQILREWSALGVELNTRGLLEWDASVSYVHPAVVMGSDGQVYVSVADNTGVDPVTDTANASWKLLARQGPVGPVGPVGPTSQFTYETLNTNGDVGTDSDQLARGNHTHALTMGSVTELHNFSGGANGNVDRTYTPSSTPIGVMVVADMYVSNFGVNGSNDSNGTVTISYDGTQIVTRTGNFPNIRNPLGGHHGMGCVVGVAWVTSAGPHTVRIRMTGIDTNSAWAGRIRTAELTLT